jgi:putative oxidoreductase
MLASTSTSASTVTESTFPFVGRALLALLFIPSGWAKIVGYSGVVGFIASKGVPFPELAAVIAIAAELGLGLLLLFGFKARWAALGLAVFLAVITPIFHNFWAAPAAQQMMQQQSFYKNIAVLGGLLVLFAFGPGRWSVDAKLGAA